MKVINVSEVCKVTQISKTNNDAWEKMIKLMENETGDVQFDFQDVNLIEPWNNEMFKKLLGNEHVYIKVYSSDTIRKTIELACLIGNMKPGRVTNEDEVVEATDSVQDKQLDRMAQRFKDNMIIDEGTTYLNVPDVCDNIGEFSTIKALEKAIVDFREQYNVKRFAVNTDLMFIQNNIIELLAKIKSKLEPSGIEVIIMSQDSAVRGKLNIYQYTDWAKKLTAAEKIKIFTDTMRVNTVGMISKYKDTKRVDEFGRKGDGTPIMCRVAIFKGLKDGNLWFTTYNGNYFFTKLHYELDNDGDQLTELVSEDLILNIHQVGLAEKYPGSLYHFSLPIQYSKKDYITSYKTDPDGEVTTTKVTLPEHIKMVLDDFGVPYDTQNIFDAIGKTFSYLSNIEEE